MVSGTGSLGTTLHISWSFTHPLHRIPITRDVFLQKLDQTGFEMFFKDGYSEISGKQFLVRFTPFPVVASLKWV